MPPTPAVSTSRTVRFTPQTRSPASLLQAPTRAMAVVRRAHVDPLLRPGGERPRRDVSAPTPPKPTMHCPRLPRAPCPYCAQTCNFDVLYACAVARVKPKPPTLPQSPSLAADHEPLPTHRYLTAANYDFSCTKRTAPTPQCPQAHSPALALGRRRPLKEPAPQAQHPHGDEPRCAAICNF
jgi:hypothetical protein